MSLDPGFLVLVLVAVFVAAVVNGIAGFGYALLGVVAVSLLADPRLAVMSISLVTPFLTTLQLRFHWSQRSVARRLTVLLVGAVIGNIIGAQLLLIAPAWMLSVSLGVFALWYAWSSARSDRPTMAAGTERRLAPFVGLAAGTMNGTLGASGPVLGSYLHAIGLRLNAFAFAISLVFAVMSGVRLVTLVALDAYTTEVVTLGLAMIVPSIVGQRIGFFINRRLSAHRFERIILALLIVAGVNLVIKGALDADFWR